MSLDFNTILTDLPELVALVPVVEASLAKLKASKNQAGDFCVFASEVLGAVGPLANLIQSQAASPAPAPKP